MNTKKEMGNIIGAVIVCVIILFSFAYLFCLGDSLMNEQQEHIDTLESAAYDTTALDSWCKGEDSKVRMIGAHEYMSNDDGVVLEDDNGNLWGIDSIDVTADDFLLIWINDNNTPDDVTDDYIVKVWKEARG